MLRAQPVLATPWGSQSCDPVPEGLHAGLPPMGAAIPRPGAGRAQPDRAGAKLQSRPIRATPWGSQSCDPVPEGTARRARSPAPSPVRLGRPPTVAIPRAGGRLGPPGPEPCPGPGPYGAASLGAAIPRPGSGRA